MALFEAIKRHNLDGIEVQDERLSNLQYEITLLSGTQAGQLAEAMRVVLESAARNTQVSIDEEGFYKLKEDFERAVKRELDVPEL